MILSRIHSTKGQEWQLSGVEFEEVSVRSRCIAAAQLGDVKDRFGSKPTRCPPPSYFPRNDRLPRRSCHPVHKLLAFSRFHQRVFGGADQHEAILVAQPHAL